MSYNDCVICPYCNYNFDNKPPRGDDGYYLYELYGEKEETIKCLECTKEFWVKVELIPRFYYCSLEAYKKTEDVEDGQWEDENEY